MYAVTYVFGPKISVQLFFSQGSKYDLQTKIKKHEGF